MSLSPSVVSRQHIQCGAKWFIFSRQYLCQTTALTGRHQLYTKRYDSRSHSNEGEVWMHKEQEVCVRTRVYGWIDTTQSKTGIFFMWTHKSVPPHKPHSCWRAHVLSRETLSLDQKALSEFDWQQVTILPNHNVVFDRAGANFRLPSDAAKMLRRRRPHFLKHLVRGLWSSWGLQAKSCQGLVWLALNSIKMCPGLSYSWSHKVCFGS